MSARANSDTVGSNVTKYAMGYAMTAAQISNILLDLLAEQRSAEADAIAVVRPKSRAGSIGEPTKYPIKQTRIAKNNCLPKSKKNNESSLFFFVFFVVY